MDDFLTTFRATLFAALAAAALLLCLRRANREAIRNWQILLLYCLLIVIGRAPSLFIPVFMNPDESMLVAIAMKFAHNPIPWSAMDPTTSGPINAYALLPLHFLGIPFGTELARATAITLVSLHVCLLYCALYRIGGRTSALVCTAPMVAFFALCTDYNLLHYSSELTSIALLSAMLLLIANLPTLYGTHGRIQWSLMLVGILGFAIALGKLQALPLTLAIGVAGVLSIVNWSGWRWSYLLWIAAGACASGLALAVILLANGALRDFYISYLLLPGVYVHSPLPLSSLFGLATSTIEGKYFVGISAAVACISLATAAAIRNWSLREIALRGISITLIAIGCYITLTRSGRPFLHYLNFLPIALALICFYLLPTWRMVDPTPSQMRRQRTWPWMGRIIPIAVGLSLTLQLAAHIRDDWATRHAPPLIFWGDPNSSKWIYQAFDSMADSNDTLAIWGWSAHLWPFSGLTPATRDPNTEFARLNFGPDNYYRKRLLDDLRRSNAPFFVEAVAIGDDIHFGYHDRKKNGIEIFPELAEEISKNYIRVLDDGIMRLYVLRSRFDTCCSFVHIDPSTDASLNHFAFDAMPIPQLCKINDFCIGSQTPDDTSTRSLEFSIAASAVPRVLFVPFIMGSNERSTLSITAQPIGSAPQSPSTQTCETTITAAVAQNYSICVLNLTASLNPWRVAITDSATSPGQWIAIGQPILASHRDSSSKH